MAEKQKYNNYEWTMPQRSEEFVIKFENINVDKNTFDLIISKTKSVNVYKKFVVLDELNNQANNYKYKAVIETVDMLQQFFDKWMEKKDRFIITEDKNKCSIMIRFDGTSTGVIEEYLIEVGNANISSSFSKTEQINVNKELNDRISRLEKEKEKLKRTVEELLEPNQICNELQVQIYKNKIILTINNQNQNLENFYIGYDTNPDNYSITSKDCVYFTQWFNSGFRLRPIYKASNVENNLGFKASTFHTKCHEIKNLLIIITSSNERRFGGYTPQCFRNEDGNFVQDKTLKSFLFSLDNVSKFPLKKEKSTRSIRNEIKFGPIFGEVDLLIKDDCNKNYSSSKLGEAYDTLGLCLNLEQGKKLLAGEDMFKVKDIEFFQVILD